MIRNLIRLLAEARRGSGEDGCQAQATGSFKQIFTWFFQRLNENTDTFGKKCLKNNHHVNLARNCPCNLYQLKTHRTPNDAKCLLQKKIVHQIPPFSLDKMQHQHMLESFYPVSSGQTKTHAKLAFKLILREFHPNYN